MSGSDLVLIAFVGDKAEVHPLPATGKVTLGRAEDNDVPVADSAASRKHCVLHLGPPLALEDLGGANGTFIRPRGETSHASETQNLHQLSRETVPIRVGDRITVGSSVFVVRRAPKRVPGGQSEEFVIATPAMRALYERAGRVAGTGLHVLITGETGVGKEVLARAIHDRSPRAKKPFLGLNCAALTESLLESELFGHEKGSFTGALQARAGLFESAEGGTVFLDEVGELAKSTQAKLLRVLEDHKVLRIGGRQPKTIDVRFVSATNRDLEKEIENGTFREDLFFRLNGLLATIPPLRERREEIEPLAQLFAERVCQELDRDGVPPFSPEVLAVFHSYAWPGNVRELKNVVERAIVLSAGTALSLDDLPAKLRDAPRAPRPDELLSRPVSSRGGETIAAEQERLQAELADLEKQRVIEALEKCAGNQTQAAELLGISRRTLVTRLATYDLPRPRKR